ncbi:hypothetical protein K450DRAFT_266408 [Umbelopsis ramanniana AG]|uniref:Arabinogalactan endo-beta-1,4-galactanase n=1 Tax=Umbelopsis ramanniana AG TaxID=1314678 RepID=A0AAD5E6V6_UMBRA|nr:uncharacterized protein K450DRAFT_266408 [Umbelopsis ramanniana AG]KAI8577391.1 hypothetical protein K450DRAFT_266408 [Umbelopsis ramanniana AG]
MLEAAGQKYYVSGTQKKFDAIIQSAGANYVRSRIWVNPSDGYYNLAYNLALAKRAKALGLKFYLDFHYSGNNLSWQVYNYTKSVVTSFVSQGTPVDMVAIGNEITNGLLWPTGSTSNWANIASILHSAAWGVKDASTTQPLIVVHTDNGWNQATQTWFYSNLMAQGTFLSTDFDIMGFSFYPFYGTSATLANLKATLNYMISTYGKDVIIAETDFPNSCSGVTLSESSIPISAAGQTTWVKDIVSLLEGLPNGHGKGVFYWEPAWVGNAGLGSSCTSALLVDSSGNTLSSINMYA